MNSSKELMLKIIRTILSTTWSIKSLDLIKIKIDEKSYRNILTYYISYKATNNVKYLYLIINKINGCIEENNENKYLTLVPSDKSKDILKNMKNYGTESKILLDQQALTHMIMIRNISKSNLVLMTIYLQGKR